jgi:alanine dehydrogenase
LTLTLSERDVLGLLDMKEVVASVEEAFLRQAEGEASNSPRTRSRSPGGVLNVMHAALPYLGRAGLKAYTSSSAGTKFIVALFDLADSRPLAVIGAENLGRFRTGAASGVATRHLYPRRSGTLAVFGSGRQALTQVLAVESVVSLDEVHVWSPTEAHRDEFVRALKGRGIKASAFPSPAEASKGADIACTITSSKQPFLDGETVRDLAHINVCGGNNLDNSELTPDAVGSFDSVVVDDIPQAKTEYGDLALAAKAGRFSWDSAIPLCKVVSGDAKPKGRTLFKSGGAALEDVAVASMVYDKAMRSGKYAASKVELT